MVCTGMTAVLLAEAHADVASAATTGCKVLPAAPGTSTAPSPSPSPSPTGSSQATSSASPKGSASSDTAATANGPSANPPEICLSVAASAASVHPGHDAVYTMSVYPANAGADHVVVNLSSIAGDASPALPSPTFTVCGSGDGTAACSLGALAQNQAVQMEAQIAVPGGAASGDTATLVSEVTAAASGATVTGSITGKATVDVVAAPKTSPPPKHHGGSGGGHSGHSGHSSGGSSRGGSNSGNSSGSGSGGTTGDESPLNNLPPLVSSGDGTSASTSGDSASSDLFPTINPSSGSGSRGHKPPARPYRATAVADVLPLNPGQLSTQLAGLIVLGLGVMLVFARITLRKPRSSEAKPQ